MPSRWIAFCLVGAVLFASAAGCLGSSQAVSDEDATERALAAEEAHITTQLENASCVESWGLESYAGVETESTIVNRTGDGVRVDVIHPYWYSTANDEADSAAEATYLVTADDAQRVNGNTIITC